ncbi:MAG: hypothetical protein ACF8AM_07835 [Rhodopirellula sp. JB055]|uniref:hypothetical protein n=1 Tax=Rhodopirellula sp. JB055 TaxID=3342846 RepID=UPI00370B1480
MICDLDSSIPEWMVEHPETEHVFNECKLDTSCAGKSLRYVCIQAGFSPPEILQRLKTAINQSKCDD